MLDSRGMRRMDYVWCALPFLLSLVALGCVAATGGGMSEGTDAEESRDSSGTGSESGDDGSNSGSDGEDASSGDPSAVPSRNDAEPGALARQPVHVSVGTGHSCARLQSGEAYCWGGHELGQLGDGEPAEDGVATPVGFEVEQVRQISADGVHTCAVTTGGDVYCVGGNWGGQLGNGSTDAAAEPVRVQMDGEAVHVTAGLAHSCAALASGEVRCWGHNSSKQLGPQAAGDEPNPIQVPGLDDVTQVEAGGASTCALTSDGTVHCWGSNCSGQLGDGSSAVCGRFEQSKRAEPGEVPDLPEIVQIDMGSNHVCALSRSGDVYCWGANSAGQIGDPDVGQNTLTPVQVPGLDSATYVMGGERHSCATVESGELQCWGGNSRGQLGIGSMEASETPTPVEGMGDALQVDGSTHTCAVSEDGQLHCWGSTGQGQLGTGEFENDPLLEPAPVAL